jgi:KDO2-lipid IV(A) lauroyltransferase
MSAALSFLLRLVLGALGTAVSFVPRSWELALGPVLGRLALRVDRRRRKIARDNIRRCLPELGPAGRDRLVRENFEHYGVLFFELLHMFSPLPGHYRAYARRTARLEGLEHWKRAHDKGKGVLFVSAHLGNWELMAAVGAMGGVPLTIVTRHLKPEWLHLKMLEARRSVDFGCFFNNENPARRILGALRKGESVGFVMDQYAPPPTGTKVPFFGIEVDTLAAVGTFAERAGAAIIPVYQRRGADGVVRVVIEPELDLGEARRDPAASTALLSLKTEEWIRGAPAQWLWAHRRFKGVVWADEAQPGEVVDSRPCTPATGTQAATTSTSS